MPRTVSHRHDSEHRHDQEHQIAAADGGDAVRCERVDLDRYAILRHGDVIGFVEAVPRVFVCYLGDPFARAVEIAQTIDFDRAVAFVVKAAGGRISEESAHFSTADGVPLSGRASRRQ